MMNRLRRSFRDSFRLKKKDRLPESSKPHQWVDDEKSVRDGDCHFPVKYLGNVQVSDARGMQVCEEAMNTLRSSRRKPIKGQLYVTGDGLRVVDDDKRGLIVDQTIEKVSFCAPDRQNDKGFSYICRDGTTRRWVLHGFHAVKDSGERLSHAVGCAFAICLEKKQKRDRDLEASRSSSSTTAQAISSSIPSSSPFQRNSSFRHSSIRERMKDPQVVKPEVSKPPSKPVVNPFAIERPHATAQLLERQGSFRGFAGLSSASPFKRQLSLRLNELPSNIARQGRFSSLSTTTGSNSNNSNNNNNEYNGRSKVDSINYKLGEQNMRSNSASNCPSTMFSPLDNSSFIRPSNGIVSNGSLLNSNLNNNLDEKSDIPASQYIASITDMCKELTQGLALLSHDQSDHLNGNSDELSYRTNSPDSHYISAFDNCESTTSSQINTSSGDTNLWPTRVSSNNDAIGYRFEKCNLNSSPHKIDLISPTLAPSSNMNSLPTATVAPLMSPVVVKTLSNGIKDTSYIKKQFAPQVDRTVTVTSSRQSGPHFNRRPVPPPPISNESPIRKINQKPLAIPKSTTIRSNSSSNSLDLSKVWPASIDDPFDAEWTNLVAKNLSLTTKSSTSHKERDTNKIFSDSSMKIHSEKLAKSSSTSSSPSSDVSSSNEFTRSILDIAPHSVDNNYVISTNPFTRVDLPSKASGLKKEFQIDM